MWAHSKKVGIYKVGRETSAEHNGTEMLALDTQSSYHCENKFLLFNLYNLCYRSISWLIYPSDGRYHVWDILILV